MSMFPIDQGAISYNPLSSTILLLNFEQAAIANIVDLTGSTSPVLGGAGSEVLTTATFKYGSKSLASGTPGQAIQCTKKAGFTIQGGDFTVDAWVNINSISGVAYTQADKFVFTLQGTSLSGVGQFGMSFTTGTGWVLAYTGTNATTFAGGPKGGKAISTQTWNHIAYMKAGNNLYFAVNGVVDQIPMPALQPIISTGTLVFTVGNITASHPTFIGYTDMFRVSNGTIFSTSSFATPGASDYGFGS